MMDFQQFQMYKTFKLVVFQTLNLPKIQISNACKTLDYVEPQETLPPTEYKCGQCDFVGKTNGVLLNHVKSHRQCDMCGKKFVGNMSSRDYARHIRTHLSPVFTFKCEKCDKTFDRKSKFDRHCQSIKCIRNHNPM